LCIPLESDSFLLPHPSFSHMSIEIGFSFSSYRRPIVNPEYPCSFERVVVTVSRHPRIRVLVNTIRLSVLLGLPQPTLRGFLLRKKTWASQALSYSLSKSLIRENKKFCNRSGVIEAGFRRRLFSWVREEGRRHSCQESRHRQQG